MSGPVFEPAGILETLIRHRVRFVLIGGLAGKVWGSPLVTFDVDVCYSREQEDLERLASALLELGATLRGAPADLPFRLDARTLAMGDSFAFSTRLGPLDCLGTPAGTRGHAELDRAATEFDIDGLTVRVVSLDDLIRMKLAAGRAKDREAAETLGALREELEREGRL
ncbi:MAG: hypothetical protein AABZ26_01590 [Chloroflexota bacterium]